MSEYKLDMSKYTIDEQPIMWTDAEYREAFQSLYFEYHKLKRERDKLEAQKIEFARSYKRVVEEKEKLKEENEELRE